MKACCSYEKRNWVVKCLYLLCLSVILFLSCGKDDLPNVLLISLDTCRADHLSVYGYHRQTSPFIDELSSRGIRYENAFINTCCTLSSHTTILSSLYQETHKVAYFEGHKGAVPDSVVMIQEILRRNGYVTLAVTDGGLAGQKYGFGRGFDYFDDIGGGVLSGTRKIVDLINLVRQQQNRRKPIFAFYHTYELHNPYAPPAEYTDIFGHFESSFSPTNENLLKFRQRARDLKEEDIESLVAMYDAEIRYTDNTLKSMFDKLEKVGFLENCLVILTSDHGEEFGEHGGLLHGDLYDEQLHVPLIITGTKIPIGQVDAQVVSSVDIAPTVLGYLELPVPEKMEGTNLLAAGNSKSEAAVFSQIGKSRYSIRTARWKLIETVNPLNLELYDVQKDTYEKEDIAVNEPRVLSQLYRRLREWQNKHRFAPMRKKVPKKVRLDRREIEQLKALGYIK
ncbi:MAG: DUF229 domain-containing protein [Caldithrix sp.]|nr:MAG: DUF229 domain-containing protein [Caldithrix sp.]